MAFTYRNPGNFNLPSHESCVCVCEILLRLVLHTCHFIRAICTFIIHIIEKVSRFEEKTFIQKNLEKIKVILKKTTTLKNSRKNCLAVSGIEDSVPRETTH